MIVLQLPSREGTMSTYTGGAFTVCVSPQAHTPDGCQLSAGGHSSLLTAATNLCAVSWAGTWGQVIIGPLSFSPLCHRRRCIPSFCFEKWGNKDTERVKHAKTVYWEDQNWYLSPACIINQPQHLAGAAHLAPKLGSQSQGVHTHAYHSVLAGGWGTHSGKSSQVRKRHLYFHSVKYLSCTSLSFTHTHNTYMHIFTYYILIYYIFYVYLYIIYMHILTYYIYLYIICI